MRLKGKKYGRILIPVTVVATLLVIFLGNKAVVATSTDEFCASCHIHPHSTDSWKLSTHYDNKHGHPCEVCGLSPSSPWRRIPGRKNKDRPRDVYGKLFKDPESFNWEAKSQIEYAKKHAFETSCIHCHQNNYPLGLTAEGREAHLYYEQKDGELHCINCHITVGHYDPDRMHAKNYRFRDW